MTNIYVIKFIVFLVLAMFPLTIRSSEHMHRKRNQYHLTDFVINAERLSVTNFAFHPHLNEIDWLDAILGDQAVFWNITRPELDMNLPTDTEYSNFPGGRKIVRKARSNYVRYLRKSSFPTLHLTPPRCGIEILGFVRIGSSAPFLGHADRYMHPSIGTAHLINIEKQHSIHKTKLGWHCFYRALYSNRRVADHKNSFWTMVLVCPARHESIYCSTFHSHFINKTSVVYNLTINLFDSSSWSVQLPVTHIETIHHNNSSTGSTRSDEKELHIKGLRLQDELKLGLMANETIAVCTVWPYVATDRKLMTANQALIFEFLRYYTAHHMRVIVFDRDGANLNNLFSSKYVHDHSFNQTKMMQYISYHNYTIHSLLLPSIDSDVEPISADVDQNADAEAMYRQLQLFDNDKALTSTYCRTQAKMMYNIDWVIVIDFDEFLYCPNTKQQTVLNHAEGLKKRLYDMRKVTIIDQVTFGKATIAHKAYDGDILSCIFQTIHQSTSTGNSIYDCFASATAIESIPNVKSLHMGRRCPFTSMHYSCVPKYYEYKAFDCICRSVEMPDCYFLHLSLMNSSYPAMSKYTKDELQASQCELKALIKAS